MGMVQSKKEDNSVYKVGCLGKISDYQKSKDGRVLINLTGITRFEILDEKINDKLYREFKVNYKIFEEDLIQETQKNTSNLMKKLKYFLKEMVFYLIGKNLKNLIKIKKLILWL